MKFEQAITVINPTVPGFTNPKVLGFIYNLVLEAKPERCVEIGSYMGRSASIISLALTILGGKRSLHCIDLFEVKTDEDYFKLPIIRDTMNSIGSAKRLYQDSTKMKSISDCFDLTVERMPYMQDIVHKVAQNSGSDWNPEGTTFQLSYIDGDHSYEGVRRDTLSILKYATEDHVMIFDDYSTQFPGVIRFVEEFREAPGVTFIGHQHPDIAFKIDDPSVVLEKLTA